MNEGQQKFYETTMQKIAEKLKSSLTYKKEGLQSGFEFATDVNEELTVDKNDEYKAQNTGSLLQT